MEITVKIDYKNSRLQELRKARGLSQGKLSELSGISVRVIQDYERGARNLNGAKLYTLLLLCETLGCTLHDIITDPNTLKLLDKIYPPAQTKV